MLLLDEASSSVDPETDALIQRTIRTVREAVGQCASVSVLTWQRRRVAHCVLRGVACLFACLLVYLLLYQRAGVCPVHRDHHRPQVRAVS